MSGSNSNAMEHRPAPADRPARVWLRTAAMFGRRRWPDERVRQILVGCRYSMLIDFIVNLPRLLPDLELAVLKACQIILLTCGGPGLPAPLKQEQASGKPYRYEGETFLEIERSDRLAAGPVPSVAEILADPTHHLAPEYAHGQGYDHGPGKGRKV
jgi:hypothetical protein